VIRIVHLGEALPPQGLEPSPLKAGHAVAGLVGPQAVELLTQDVGFEQPAIGREELRQLRALRAADGLPPPQQQPPFAAAERPHHGALAKELVAAHLVERGPGVLQHMELVVDDLGLRQGRGHGVAVGAMHVGADGFDGRALARIEARRQQARQTLFGAVLGQPEHLAMHQVGEDGVSEAPLRQRQALGRSTVFDVAELRIVDVVPTSFPMNARAEALH
jgi:hypothetical protein